jgi:hypothetical protein
MFELEFVVMIILIVKNIIQTSQNEYLEYKTEWLEFDTLFSYKHNLSRYEYLINNIKLVLGQKIYILQRFFLQILFCT